MGQVELLNQQLAALRNQLAALEASLQTAQNKDKEAQNRISDPSVNLAEHVNELQRYRSDFFGKLRDILGDRPDIRVVGDRFVFQSEVFFDSGKVTKRNRHQATTPPPTNATNATTPPLSPLQPTNATNHQHPPTSPTALRTPPTPPPTPPTRPVTGGRKYCSNSRANSADLAWILRVDGHTDVRPVTGTVFKSNWDLSAARAIAVVQYSTTKGVSAQRLAAAGFGEFQPIDTGVGEEAYRRNRRIEFKLTEPVKRSRSISIRSKITSRRRRRSPNTAPRTRDAHKL